MARLNAMGVQAPQALHNRTDPVKPKSLCCPEGCLPVKCLLQGGLLRIGKLDRSMRRQQSHQCQAGLPLLQRTASKGSQGCSLSTQMEELPQMLGTVGESFPWANDCLRLAVVGSIASAVPGPHCHLGRAHHQCCSVHCNHCILEGAEDTVHVAPFTGRPRSTCECWPAGMR